MSVGLFLGFTVAHAGELMFHNSFSACWTTAITKSSFLTLVRNSIEGTQGCVSAQSGTSPFPYTVCGSPNCPGGTIGCPVTLHAATPTGDFGTGAVNATGTVDTLTVPITYNMGAGPQSCTMTLTNIATSYALQYTLTPDGNYGAYTASLATPTVSITSYTPGGNCPSLFLSLAAGAASQTQTAAANAIHPLLIAGTVDESVCPLTP
ncbi:hypothetical protein [Tahibacter amnicola]|uniref:Uncharacterized protein n=1 Tax=Tahibacter amnicola TaxID=2976241 RepID=A0ABY6BAD5_9GAMM|nr:hypothetical protein [Tahibacter amnicola]UXI67026.1 hypothetical protein N4264_20070 [Tahibacter amnicola]